MLWFKHDTDASQDAKLQNVLLDYGLEGYGLYWHCIELIAGRVDKDNITFELEHDARIIARNVGSTSQKVEEMMRYFVDAGLFESSNGVITCLKLAKRLDKSMTSNPQMRHVIGSLSLNKTVKEGYVYFIENSDDKGNVKEIKIGRSANPSARFAEHKKKYEEFGFNLNLVQTIKSNDCIALETEIHRKLKGHAVRKEWFDANEEVLELLRHDYGVTTSCKIRLDKIRLDKIRLDKNKLNTKIPAEAVNYSVLQMTKDELLELKRIRKQNGGKAITQRVANELAKQFLLASDAGYTLDEVFTEWETRGWKSFKSEWLNKKADSSGLSKLAQKNIQNTAGAW